ncbi:MAG: imidazole glycerol phosphate synthase subunit HisH [Planctomycetota bacterium]|jgi:glutamine amidotransferase
MTNIPKIVIIDYHCGNLFSIQQALCKVGVSSLISKSPEDISKADKIILPGVGAFGDGMEKLESYDLVDAIREFALSGKPILGICLGAQLLFDESFEFGHHKGLKLIPGSVTQLQKNLPHNGSVKIPHIGWNTISFTNNAYTYRNFFRDLNNETYMYFLHSFGIKTKNLENCVAETSYGTNTFCAITQKENILGVQFHPEISGPAGLKLLDNYVFD